MGKKLADGCGVVVGAGDTLGAGVATVGSALEVGRAVVGTGEVVGAVVDCVGAAEGWGD